MLTSCGDKPKLTAACRSNALPSNERSSTGRPDSMPKDAISPKRTMKTTCPPRSRVGKDRPSATKQTMQAKHQMARRKLSTVTSRNHETTV